MENRENLIKFFTDKYNLERVEIEILVDESYRRQLNYFEDNPKIKMNFNRAWKNDIAYHIKIQTKI